MPTLGDQTIGKEIAVTYYDAKGKPVGLVVRWDRPEGKEIRPVAQHAAGWRIEMTT